MQSVPTRISCCISAILVLPMISARIVLPLWIVAKQPGALDDAVGPRHVRAAPALDEHRFDASAYSAPQVFEVENAELDDAEDATMDGNGQEDFVNIKVRRIARLMQGKHPPFVRFG